MVIALETKDIMRLACVEAVVMAAGAAAQLDKVDDASFISS